MKSSQEQHLQDLAKELVTPERFGEIQPIAELAAIASMYPDLPETLGAEA